MTELIKIHISSHHNSYKYNTLSRDLAKVKRLDLRYRDIVVERKQDKGFGDH